jgi:hypothetical protein
VNSGLFVANSALFVGYAVFHGDWGGGFIVGFLRILKFLQMSVYFFSVP